MASNSSSALTDKTLLAMLFYAGFSHCPFLGKRHDLFCGPDFRTYTTLESFLNSRFGK